MTVRGRGGFTLIELVTVVVIVGILAGIALPNFRSAIYRADAAKIVADMSAVRFALFEFREDKNALPRRGRWGQAPAELEPYIGGMSFQYKDVEYRLQVNQRRGHVEFIVRYPRRSPIGAALQPYRVPGNQSGSVSWTSRRTTFRLLRNNR